MKSIRKSKKELLGATAAMVVLSPLVLQNANAASLSVGASAVIRQAINLTQQQSLNFGSLSETGGGGTVTLNFSDSINDGPGALRPVVGGSTTSGHVTITGQAGIPVLVSSETSTFKLLNGGGGATSTEMTVKDIVYRMNGQNGANLSVTLGTGVNDLDIGAKLVSSGQAAGTYSGSFTVNVVYP